MSTIYLLLLIIFVFNGSYSLDNLVFQIQPQSVLINNLDEIYITSDDHYIGQVLYRYDRIQLACECQTQLNHTTYFIYWTINKKISNQYNNSNIIQLIINRKTVQIPITYVTCYCVFIQSNLTKIKIHYQYQLYIDLESEPSLKAIHYSVQTSVIKEHFYNFIHYHSFVIFCFMLIIIEITCPLIILSFASIH